MEFWRTFWTIVCTIGFTGFFILVLVVTPRGACELRDLFRALESETDRIHPGQESGGDTTKPAENNGQTAQT